MSTDPRIETIRLLTSLVTELRTLNGTVTALAGTVLDMAARQTTQTAAAPQTPAVDLDGPHGDPVVKAKDPRNWTGETMKGRTFSQCPPAYLDQLADRYDFFAGKEDSSEKDRKYARLDGARARAWAARLRGGWTAPASADPVPDDYGTSDGGPTW